MTTGDETATFSFNFAPSACVLTVTRPDGSVVRHVTIEAGAVDQPSAAVPSVEQLLPGRRLDLMRQRRRRVGVAGRLDTLARD